jgi:iron complex outermembrane receptor protein
MSNRSRTHADAAAATLFSTTSISAQLAIAAFAGALWPALASAQTAPQAQDQTSETIIVTASPVSGDPDRFATIVTQVNRDQILQSGGANIADALRDVPGVSDTSFAAGASRPVIRGMDAFRVATLENGLSTADVSEVGPDHGVPIDPLSARDIEVVRGAATLRYGSQAIGGVVNAINNRVPTSLPTTPLSGEISGGYDSNGASTDGSALVDASAGQFAFHADAFGRRASNYDTPDGKVFNGLFPNSFFHGGGYSLGSSYFFGDNNADRAGLAFTHYDAKYGIPSDTTFIDMRQNKITGASSLQFGDGLFQALNFNGQYSDYVHNEKDPDGTIESTFRNREWNGRMETLLGGFGPFSAEAVGVQYGDRRFSVTGDDFLLPTHTQTEAVFAFGESNFGNAHIQTAARVEHTIVSGTPAPVYGGLPTETDFTPISASVGALFDLTSNLKFGVTLSSAARAPGQVELFARGPHDGPETFEIGDPNLKIERANSLEATLRWRTQRLQIQGALWGSRFSNYIYGDVTGRLCDDSYSCVTPPTPPGPDQDLKELFYAQRDATFWGAEAEAHYDLAAIESGVLRINGLADYVRADFTDGGGAVPRIQPYRVGAGLDWLGDSFDAGFMFVYVGAQDHVPAGDTTTKSFVELDAQAAWRPLHTNQGFEIALVGHNLTDDVQRNAVALNRDVVELPGRDVRLVLRQSF